ncbi:hypothetical protein VNO78_10536 [Psophocarpus tetragonolobus]|uniref:Uncharacterized protein n=1 Tax=Psophocarpus tetragonolobus TaxID=3891 RepID=A0AAN9XMU8_PSOTE
MVTKILHNAITNVEIILVAFEDQATVKEVPTSDKGPRVPDSKLARTYLRADFFPIELRLSGSNDGKVTSYSDLLRHKWTIVSEKAERFEANNKEISSDLVDLRDRFQGRKLARSKLATLEEIVVTLQQQLAGALKNSEEDARAHKWSQVRDDPLMDEDEGENEEGEEEVVE